MDPVERGKFCHQCEKQVYDFSQMTEGEAKALIGSCGAGSICVRYRHDRAGNILFRPMRQVAALAVGLAACTPHGDTVEQVLGFVPPAISRFAPRPVMGEPAPAPCPPDEEHHDEDVLMGDIAELPIDPEPKAQIPEANTPPDDDDDTHELMGEIAEPPAGEEPPEDPVVDAPPAAEEPEVRHVMGRIPASKSFRETL